MTRYFTMHLENPQPRLIAQAAEAVKRGELIVYPTDSTYAFGCALSSKTGVDKIRQLRGLSDKHPLTLVCHNISQASQYAVIDNKAFNFIKNNTPGPFTIILPATKLVPRPIQGVKRKVVGIRIPDNAVALDLIGSVGEPILSATLWLKEDETPLQDPAEVPKRTRGYVSLVLDTGIGEVVPTSVIDFTQDEPTLIREGKAS